MKKELFVIRGGQYEPPTTTLVDVTSEGLLCVSMATELEVYDCLDEQGW